jgi:HlyD family secretion protein
MDSPRSVASAQARQTRQQFANPEDYLSYELGKAVRELPPLYTRLLAGSLTALVLGTIAWAHFSKVDEVAVTQGELIPAQQIRPVKALDGGVIRAIRVKEGDRVHKGDILIEQDPAVPQAAVGRLRKSAELVRQDITRLEAERTGQTTASTPIQNQLLAARLRDFDTRQAAAIAEANRQAAAIAEAQAKLVRLQDNLANASSTLANAEERERSLRSLVNVEGAVPRFDYMEAKDRLIQAQDQVASLKQDIAAQQQTIQQARQAYQGARETANNLVSQRQSEVISQLNQRREDLTSLEGQLEQAQKQQDRETLRAPVSGKIYNLQATLGEGTVEPGEELLSILPDGNNNLVLQVKILNRDIGFVKEGMRAKVKLATFPFQEFGTLDGTLTQISPNSTMDKDLGLVYTGTVQLKQTSVKVHSHAVDLAPGMAASAEIVTRQRSILTFLIEPITRRFDEAFGVR